MAIEIVDNGGGLCTEYAVTPMFIPKPTYSTIPIRTKADGMVNMITDADFRGGIVEPAKTEYFKNSSAPANHTTGTIPTGTYTMAVIVGTGSLTAAAGTAVGTFGTATATTPATITITTAGTVVITVTGTVTKAQLCNLPYKSSFVDNGATTTTRQAVTITRPTAGVFPADGQNFFVYMRVSPMGAIAYPDMAAFGSYIDMANRIFLSKDAATTFKFYKVIAGASSDASVLYTSIAGLSVDLIAIQTQHGMAIRERHETAPGVWSAWSNWATNETAGGKLPAPIASTYQIGCVNSASHFPGEYSRCMIGKIPTAWLASLTAAEEWVVDHLTGLGGFA